MRRLAAVAALVLGANVQAAGPVPCPGAPFVAGQAILPGTDARGVAVDDTGAVSVPGACDPAPARWKRARGGSTVLRARWTACGAVERVRLRLRYDTPACTRAEGFVRARGVKRAAVVVTRSKCGDDVLDAGAGEVCELTTPCAGGLRCVNCACVPAPTTSTTTTVPGATTTTTLAGLFEAPEPWNVDVSALPPSNESAGIIAALEAAGGWGAGNNLHIDFSIHVLTAGPTTPFLTFAPAVGYYTPDCDDPFPFPLPVGGAIEGQSGYACDVGGEDCHLLVVDAAAKRLYEAYSTTLDAGTLSSLCALTWDLTKPYPPNGRGEQCTSADAAGLPIAALLFTADEVAAGEIPHAIRFILPNERMRAGVYVHPASHAGAPSGGPALPPYGVRFRLRADFPLASLPSEGARVIARAMQKYGMILADGGNVALTAASDAYTAHTWDQVGVDSHSLYGIGVGDMEVVALGPTIPLTYDCVRNP